MSLPFADWLPQQRWYAGRGRTIRQVETVAATPLTEGPAQADMEHMLLRVIYEEGGADLYQVIVVWDRPPNDEYVGVSRIGEIGGRTAYDALYGEEASRELLAMIAAGRSIGDLRFTPEPDVEFTVDSTARVIDGEQSNTSVVFDTSSILKLFRRVVPGMNPDLELTRVLGRAGSPYVARLLGAIEAPDFRGEPLSLATLTSFAANAADGWAMAVASTRDLIANPEMPASEAGGDFAGEAFRLGEAVASVHTTLGDELGREVGQPAVNHLIERLHAAIEAVPELGPHVDAATEILSKAGLPTIMQRVHGDLHLGQALRTPESWILIDFEGEPGQPMADRRRYYSPMRDVAGMMRSFDYAAHQLLVDDREDETRNALATSWGARNRSAFCDGYASAAGIDPREHSDLLAAYELDKALYEAAYESRHRPNWQWIPMHAISRLLGTEATGGDADERPAEIDEHVESGRVR
jgi:maltokinase